MLKIKAVCFHFLLTLIKANLNILISTSKYGQFSELKNAVIDDIPNILVHPDNMENCDIAIVLSRYYFEDDDLNAQGQQWSCRNRFLGKLENLVEKLSVLYQLKLCFHPKTSEVYSLLVQNLRINTV